MHVEQTGSESNLKDAYVFQDFDVHFQEREDDPPV